ncbi:hypothetical protein [Candidatus Pelagadaptatus aseana]|uniref:hypothetical protein n=1 Tax=Candidatus Pelagadaptatus aseana TaxID=3120508 RepID=UPI003C6FC7D7
MPLVWEVTYDSKTVRGSIRYQLDETIDGSLLIRTLEYYPNPASPEQHKILAGLSAQVQQSSLQALRQLRQTLESDWLSKSSH